MSKKNAVSVTCANCEKEFEAMIFNVINGAILDLKTAFMQDELNTVACTYCQTEVSITTPILYFDDRKQGAIAFVPAELELDEAAQTVELADLITEAQQLIGGAASADYLASPKICENFDDLIVAVLALDGITEEMLKERSRKVELIDILMRAEGVEDFEKRVLQYDSELDRSFFDVLTNNIDVVQMNADEVTAETMLSFRRQIARFSSQGKAICEAIEAERGKIFILDRADCIDKLMAVDTMKERRKLVAASYNFTDERLFNMLTTRINEAQSGGDEALADRYRQLRSDLLGLKHQHEKESQAQLDGAEKLFKSVLNSKRPEKVLERKIGQVGESFFFVLGTNIAKARSKGDEATARALEALGQLAVTLKKQQLAAAS